MNGVFVQILKVKNFPRYKTASPLGYRAYVKLIPKDEGSFGNLNIVSTNINVDPENNTKKREFLKSPVTWNFQYKNADECSIGFSFLYDQQQFAILKLPLSWFQKNTVVTYTYPALQILNIPLPKKIMVKISIHLSENNEAAFAAPKGKLLVVPAWTANGDKRTDDKPNHLQQQQVQQQQQMQQQQIQQQQMQQQQMQQQQMQQQQIQQQQIQQQQIQQQQMQQQQIQQQVRHQQTQQQQIQKQAQIQQIQAQPQGQIQQQQIQQQIAQQQQVNQQHIQQPQIQQQPIQQQQIQTPTASPYSHDQLEQLNDSDSFIPDVEINEQQKQQQQHQQLASAVPINPYRVKGYPANPPQASPKEADKNTQAQKKKRDEFDNPNLRIDSDSESDQEATEFTQQRQRQAAPLYTNSQASLRPQFVQPPPYSYVPPYPPYQPYAAYQPVPYAMQPYAYQGGYPYPPPQYACQAQRPPPPPQYVYGYPVMYAPPNGYYQAAAAAAPPPPPMSGAQAAQQQQAYRQTQPASAYYAAAQQPQASGAQVQGQHYIQQPAQTQPFVQDQRYQQQPLPSRQLQPDSAHAEEKMKKATQQSSGNSELPSAPPPTPSHVFIPPSVTFEPSKEVEAQIRAQRQKEQETEKRRVKQSEKMSKKRKAKQLNNAESPNISVDPTIESTSMLEQSSGPQLEDAAGLGFVDDEAAPQPAIEEPPQQPPPSPQQQQPSQPQQVEKRKLKVTEKNAKIRKAKQLTNSSAMPQFSIDQTAESTSMLEQDGAPEIDDVNGLGFVDNGDDENEEQKQQNEKEDEATTIFSRKMESA